MDLSNKVVATYVVIGITYVSTIELKGKLEIPTPYEAQILKAPKDGLKELKIDGLTEDNVKYLAYGLNEDEKDVQKVATLDEIKEHIEREYKVTFKANAIKVEDGKIVVY